MIDTLTIIAAIVAIVGMLSTMVFMLAFILYMRKREGE